MRFLQWPSSLSPLQHPQSGDQSDGRALSWPLTLSLAGACKLQLLGAESQAQSLDADFGTIWPEWPFLYCVRVSSFGPLNMRALLTHIPSSYEKGFRPGHVISQAALHRVRKGEKEEPDPGTCLVLSSALKLLMAETWAWPPLPPSPAFL